jgi:hypothetical protein
VGSNFPPTVNGNSLSAQYKYQPDKMILNFYGFAGLKAFHIPCFVIKYHALKKCLPIGVFQKNAWFFLGYICTQNKMYVRSYFLLS